MAILTPDQFTELAYQRINQLVQPERDSARAKQIARLEHPDSRPSTLDRDSIHLLMQVRKPLTLLMLSAPQQIEQYLVLAVSNLTSALNEAIQPYEDLRLAPPTIATIPPRCPCLSLSQVDSLRRNNQWLALMVKTAPLEVALYLLSVTDWINITIIAGERQAQQIEQLLAEESTNRTPLHS